MLNNKVQKIGSLGHPKLPFRPPQCLKILLFNMLYCLLYRLFCLQWVSFCLCDFVTNWSASGRCCSRLVYSDPVTMPRTPLKNLTLAYLYICNLVQFPRRLEDKQWNWKLGKKKILSNVGKSTLPNYRTVIQLPRMLTSALLLVIELTVS